MKRLAILFLFLAVSSLSALSYVDGRMVTGMVRLTTNYYWQVTNISYGFVHTNDLVVIRNSSTGYPAGIYQRTSSFNLFSEGTATNWIHFLNGKVATNTVVILKFSAQSNSAWGYVTKAVTNGIGGRIVSVTNFHPYLLTNGFVIRTNGLGLKLTASATNTARTNLVGATNLFHYNLTNSFVSTQFMHQQKGMATINYVNADIQVATNSLAKIMTNAKITTNWLHQGKGVATTNYVNSENSYAMIWFTNNTGSIQASISNVGTYTIATFPTAFTGLTNNWGTGTTNGTTQSQGPFMTGYLVSTPTNIIKVNRGRSNFSAGPVSEAWTNARIQIGSAGAGTYFITANLTFAFTGPVPTEVAFVLMKNGATPLYQSFASMSPATASRFYPVNLNPIFIALTSADNITLGVRTVLNTTRIHLNSYTITVKRIQ